jgi:tetratricopeptide (TPR) repeat protein
MSINDNTNLKPQSRKYLETSRYINNLSRGVIICCLLAACSNKPLMREESTLMPPMDTQTVVQSVQVQAFSSEKNGYGARLAELVKNGIAKEGHIKVVNQSGRALLTGTLTLGKIDSKAYHRSREVTEKKDGQKHTKTVYTYYYRKQLTANATYSLNQGHEVIAGNNFATDYKQEWSAETAAEAMAKAATDEEILSICLNNLAEDIIYAVSPHQQNLTFELQKGNSLKWDVWNLPHKGLKLGVDYYEKGLYSQARDYWNQVLEQATDRTNQAAARYNLGVYEVHEGNYKEAFDHFREADRLMPHNTLYMQALKKVERAARGNSNLRQMGVP